MKFRMTLLAACVGWWPVGVTDRAAEGDVMPASKPDVRKGVIATIESQLAAFRARELAKAYGFAAATLREQTSLRAFVAIVQNSYPEIWSSTRAEFGLVRDDGERATVLVHVFAGESDAAYDYVLVKERSGGRIGPASCCRSGQPEVLALGGRSGRRHGCSRANRFECREGGLEGPPVFDDRSAADAQLLERNVGVEPQLAVFAAK